MAGGTVNICMAVVHDDDDNAFICGFDTNVNVLAEMKIRTYNG